MKRADIIPKGLFCFRAQPIYLMAAKRLPVRARHPACGNGKKPVNG